MANVNLISAKRAERVRLRRLANGMVLGTILTLGLGIAANGFQTVNWLFTQNRLAAVNRKLEDLRPVLVQIEASEAERRALMPKLLTLTQAQTATRRWFGLMDGLKRAVPEQTWLTNIAVEGASDGNQSLKISGVTVNQTRVGETMLRLNQQPEYYSRVDLRFAQVRPNGEREDVEFELAASLKAPEGGQSAPAKEGQANATQAN